MPDFSGNYLTNYTFNDPDSILNTTDSNSYLLSNTNNGITGSTGYGIGNSFSLNNTLSNFSSIPSSGLTYTTPATVSSGSSSYVDWAKNFQKNLEGNVAKIQQIANKKNPYDQGFLGSNAMGNVLGAVGLGLGALSGIGSYLNGKKYMSMLKDQMAQQNAQFNETYNNKLKEYNTSLADRLRARAAFETGNSSAYNDEITNNSLARGQTGNADSSYLNYKRSENAV